MCSRPLCHGTLTRVTSRAPADMQASADGMEAPLCHSPVGNATFHRMKWCGPESPSIRLMFHDVTRTMSHPHQRPFQPRMRHGTER